MKAALIWLVTFHACIYRLLQAALCLQCIPAEIATEEASDRIRLPVDLRWGTPAALY